MDVIAFLMSDNNEGGGGGNLELVERKGGTTDRLCQGCCLKKRNIS